MEVVSKADSYWWQAKKEGCQELLYAGLIPSPELQEWYGLRFFSLGNGRNVCHRNLFPCLT